MERGTIVSGDECLINLDVEVRDNVDLVYITKKLREALKENQMYGADYPYNGIEVKRPFDKYGNHYLTYPEHVTIELHELVSQAQEDVVNVVKLMNETLSGSEIFKKSFTMAYHGYLYDEKQELKDSSEKTVSDMFNTMLKNQVRRVGEIEEKEDNLLWKGHVTYEFEHLLNEVNHILIYYEDSKLYGFDTESKLGETSAIQYTNPLDRSSKLGNLLQFANESGVDDVVNFEKNKFRDLELLQEKLGKEWVFVKDDDTRPYLPFERHEREINYMHPLDYQYELAVNIVAARNVNTGEAFEVKGFSKDIQSESLLYFGGNLRPCTALKVSYLLESLPLEELGFKVDSRRMMGEFLLNKRELSGKDLIRPSVALEGLKILDLSVEEKSKKAENVNHKK